MANLLLADDDPALQTMYTTALQSFGHTVVVASNGEEALTLVEQNPIDLILLDVNMPVMDGFGFLEAFDRKKHPNVKIIILTNSTDVSLINKAMQLGTTNYIDKASITPGTMNQIVASVLDSPAS